MEVREVLKKKKKKKKKKGERRGRGDEQKREGEEKNKRITWLFQNDSQLEKGHTKKLDHKKEVPQ